MVQVPSGESSGEKVLQHLPIGVELLIGLWLVGIPVAIALTRLIAGQMSATKGVSATSRTTPRRLRTSRVCEETPRVRGRGRRRVPARRI